MTRRIVTPIAPLLLLLAVSSGCTRLEYDVVPEPGRVYHSLRIKVNVKYIETGERDHFKILLKYDGSRDKMLFLSPLNQVYGLLTVERENALLVNTKKKKYWTGPFSILLQELWGPGMDFDYKEFKQLLVAGVVPGDKLKRRDVRISIETANQGENREPERIIITSPAVRVRLKISNRTTGKGRVRFSVNLDRIKPAGIRDLLE